MSKDNKEEDEIRARAAWYRRHHTAHTDFEDLAWQQDAEIARLREELAAVKREMTTLTEFNAAALAKQRALEAELADVTKHDLEVSNALNAAADDIRALRKPDAAAVRVATEARAVAERVRDHSYLSGALVLNEVVLGLNNLLARTQAAANQPQPAASREGDADRAMRVDGFKNLIGDLRAADHREDWSASGKAQDALVEMFRYALAEPAAKPEQPSGAVEKCGLPFRSGPIEGSCANDKPCALHDKPPGMYYEAPSSEPARSEDEQPDHAILRGYVQAFADGNVHDEVIAALCRLALAKEGA